MYNKLCTRILDSSIWLEPDSTRIVWITLLAAMDQDGYAHFSAIQNLADRARVTLVQAEEAVKTFMSPDPNSSNPANEGRRVERVPGGFMVLNAQSIRDEVTTLIARANTAARVREWRAKQKMLNCNAGVTPSEAVSEANKNKIMGEQARPSPLPDVEKNRESKKVSRIPNGSSDSGFRRLRSLYPKRDGDQRWAEAEQHYRARLKEGVPRETIEDGVVRYAKYCKVKGIEGKEFVQQAATFLGRNRGYAAEWTLPAQPPSPFE